MTPDLSAVGPWAYVVLAAVAVVPLLPSEIAVATGGVLAAHGRLDLWLVLVAAAAGALLGDLVTFGAGRVLGRRREGRVGLPRRAPFVGRWTTAQLGREHGSLLVVARLIPGGRTVLALTAGALRVDLRYFAVRVAIGCAVWALLNGLTGYLSGAVTGTPTSGLLVGIGLATATVAVASWGRFARRRRSPYAPR